ncbi:unnamed protein product [Cylindrotheca closterium]|uniref:Uncharacterized protein n=1 Tax=Cylindrotheca closterium TaxID=2856 RepID=A0AAD2JIR9_9STRA|nr:unnamed protein product [Cylindrotheca closterium]
MEVSKNPGVNLYQGKDQPNKGKGKGKGKGKERGSGRMERRQHVMCVAMKTICLQNAQTDSQWKNQDQYVNYGKKLNLNQIGATVPATVPAIVPGASASTSNEMMQVPSGMQLMQIPTQGDGTVTVPYSMNANGEIAFSGMQLSQQGFSGA